MYRRFNTERLTLYFLLAGILAVWAVACGVKEVTPTPKASSPTSVLPPWQQKWEKTLAAARQEGKLTLYGEINPQFRDAVLAFQNKYGITMEFVVGKGSEIATKWTSEKNAGLNIVDVFHVAPGPGLTIMKPKGAFASLEPYLILPEATDPKLWLQDRIPFIDADKTTLLLNYAYTSYVTVNTDMIKEGQLKSYRDIPRPEWKGKVVLFDPTIPSAANGLVAFLVKDIYGVEGAKEFFRQLAATAPAITRDGGQIIEWVARGKYPIGVGISHASTSDYKARGAPVTINRFVEGGSINPGSGVVEVPTVQPHPNAATLYVNWLLTEEGQTAFAKGFGSAPVRKGLRVEGIDPSKVPLPGEKIFMFGEEHQKFVPEAAAIARETLGDLLK